MWFKYERNPVLLDGPPGSWDNLYAAIERVIVAEGVYHAWYTGATGLSSGAQIGYATSTNGVNWTKHPSNPVISASAEGWDSFEVLHPFVLPSEAGYRMWFSGIDGQGTFRIGYATSTDRISWSKHPEPVLDTEPSESWNRGGVLRPSVVEVADSLVMWYQGEPGLSFGLASSSNDTEWSPHPYNPIFAGGTLYYPRLRYDNESFELWYTHGYPNSTIRIATSDDAVRWQPALSPLLRPGPDPWDSPGIVLGDVHFDGAIYHMWYHNNRAPSIQTGYAVSPRGGRLDLLQEDEATYRIRYHVEDPDGLQLAALFVRSGLPADTVQLLNDGLHSDSLESDAVFGNHATLECNSQYTVHLLLALQDTLQFKMSNAQQVTTSPCTNIAVEDGLPQSYVLNQNYPNPFNPTTTISFAIPEPAHVRLEVFDLIGRRMITLVDEWRSPGKYYVPFDASGYSSGSYYYRLEANGVRLTRMLQVLR